MNSHILFRAALTVMGEEAHPPDALNPFSGMFSPLSALFVLVLLFFIVWWLLRAQVAQVEPLGHGDHDDHGDHGDHTVHAAQGHEEPAGTPAFEATESAGAEPDDLKMLEGVGPKVASVLNAAGIVTFAQLADASVESLQSLLDEAGYRYMNPASWPEQAALAAAGDWDALKKLQDELNAGRSA